ncbi:MAG TPA: hypothetical protein VEY06_00540 [Flavisolibacter sp.]|jgi:hypothetical protein|nr:hypothetical protein [Flavisolibacter sp.]
MIALPMLRDPIMVGAKGEESIPGHRQQDECISTVLSKDKRLKTSDAPLLAGIKLWTLSVFIAFDYT